MFNFEIMNMTINESNNNDGYFDDFYYKFDISELNNLKKKEDEKQINNK